MDIGNSNATSISILHNEDSDWVKFLDDLLLRKANGEMEYVKGLIQYVYNDYLSQGVNYSYLQECAILATTNNDVDEINEIMLDMLSEEKLTYFSLDSITDIQDDEQNLLYTPEFLNTLKFSGIQTTISN